MPDECIHTINTEQPTEQELTMARTTGFAPSVTFGASPIQVDPSSDFCIAKQIVYANGSIEYFIKKAADGKLFDPYNTVTENSDRRYLDRAGKTGGEFKKVNKEAYIQYITYVQNRNPVHWKHADREAFTMSR